MCEHSAGRLFLVNRPKLDPLHQKKELQFDSGHRRLVASDKPNRRVWNSRAGDPNPWGELELIERDIFGSEPVS
jgi:hypothetical protein